MVRITTKTEIQNGLKVVHVLINEASVKTFKNEYSLKYTYMTVEQRVNTAERLANEYVISLQHKLGAQYLDNVAI